jgi:hypothetical protein
MHKGAAVTEKQSDFCFDILRGLSRLTHNRLIGDIAEVVAKFRNPDLAVALNHKQIESKLFLRDHLYETLGGSHDRIWVLAGWYGVLAAMIFDDARFSIGSIVSFDIDEHCAAVAMTLNRRYAETGRFDALTQDIYALNYRREPAPSLIINTSCEHLGDLSGWLDLLPPGVLVALQSNDYRREPDHVSCVDTIDDFARQAELSQVMFAGTMVTKNYNRFTLIGRR